MKDATTTSPVTGLPSPTGSADMLLGELDLPRSVRGTDSGLAGINAGNEHGAVWTLVLDDDPTGTQTVHGLPVLMPDWPDAELEWAATQTPRTTFALTNSRSVDEASATDMTYRLVRRAARIAEAKGLRLRVVTRSDSTLRGHFRAELAAASRALADAGTPVDGVVFVPAFLEAGRYTAADTQWVAHGHVLTPAAQTEYARDRTFGYHETDLKDWVRARLGTPSAPVHSVSLAEVRGNDGVRAVTAKLDRLTGGEVLIANAMQPTDLEVLMLAILAAEEHGRRILIRSGPSFVRLCAGQTLPAPVTDDQIYPSGPGAEHGLIVVGSHTGLTNSQLAAAQQTTRLTTIELDVRAVVDPGPATAETEIQRATQAALNALPHTDVVLRTSRTLLDHGRETPLLTSRAIADALTRTVAGIVSQTRPRFLVAKGGITSSDLATRALGVRKAIVTGQMLPGQIPLWTLSDGTRPGLPYVVFPGNVGGETALAQVLTRLGVPHT